MIIEIPADVQSELDECQVGKKEKIFGCGILFVNVLSFHQVSETPDRYEIYHSSVYLPNLT